MILQRNRSRWFIIRNVTNLDSMHMIDNRLVIDNIICGDSVNHSSFAIISAGLICLPGAYELQSQVVKHCILSDPPSALSWPAFLLDLWTTQKRKQKPKIFKDDRLNIPNLDTPFCFLIGTRHSVNFIFWPFCLLHYPTPWFNCALLYFIFFVLLPCDYQTRHDYSDS